MIDPRCEAVLIADRNTGQFADKTHDVVRYETQSSEKIDIVYRGGRTYPHRPERVRTLRNPARVTLPPGAKVEVGGATWESATEVWAFTCPVGAWWRIFYRTQEGEERYRTYPASQVRVVTSATQAPAAAIPWWSRAWPRRWRRRAGTGCSCGIACAGCRRSGRCSAVAVVTERVRLGPMVTPLPRRWPVKVARETATLDVLSGGRFVLGVGLGGDASAELSKTGDQIDDRLWGQMLDESLQILTGAWSGALVRHHGRHYLVDGIQFLPTPVQRPGVPVWTAGLQGHTKPLRRAARYQGFVPVNLVHPDQLAEVVATISGLRSDPGAPYEVAIGLAPGTDPVPYAEAGATWWLTDFYPRTLSLDRVRGVLREGPAPR